MLLVRDPVRLFDRLAGHSLVPQYSTLPWRTSMSIAATVSAIGTSGIGTMAEVQVQVVHLEPLQRLVARLDHMLARKPALGRPGSSTAPKNTLLDTQ